MPLPEFPVPMGGVIDIVHDIKDIAPLIHRSTPQEPLEEGALYRVEVGPEVIVDPKFSHAEGGFRFRITPTNALIFDVVLASMDMTPEERNRTTFHLVDTQRAID